MSSTLLLLLIILALVWLWLDGARARELATAIVDELCKRRGLQLLDGTVALSRLSLARTEQGMRLKRLFRFDYSVEGVGRRQGRILLHGSQVVLVDLPEQRDERDVAPATESTASVAKDDGKVVPFRRR